MNIINILSLAAFILLFKKSSPFFLNDNEFLIATELIKELEIRHCVFVSDNMFIIDVKKFSSIKVAVTYVACDELPDYIADKHDYYLNIGIIFKQCSLTEINHWDHIVWLMFSENVEYVPYNSELIAIQQNQHTYKLIEFYTFQNKFFSFEWGTWDNGLNISKASFYTRRSNLNQSIVNTLTTTLGMVSE